MNHHVPRARPRALARTAVLATVVVFFLQLASVPLLGSARVAFGAFKAEKEPRRIILVSSRGFNPLASSGGLKRVVEDLLMITKIPFVWFSREKPPDHIAKKAPCPLRKIEVRAVDVGFGLMTNRGFWLPMHDAAKDIPYTTSSRPWKDYLTANRIAAGVISEHLRPNDVVWLHDYHFMLVPGILARINRLVREGRVHLAHYGHTSYFEEAQVTRNPENSKVVLPITNSLLYVDRAAFQTPWEAKNYLEIARSLHKKLGVRYVDIADKGGVIIRKDGHEQQVAVSPVSPSVGLFKELGARFAKMSPHELKDFLRPHHLEWLPEATDGKKVVGIFGRFDPVKNLPLALDAVEALRNDREFANIVALVQATGTRTEREFAEVKEAVDGKVSSANMRRPGSTIYIPRGLPTDALAYLYSISDVSACPSSREGFLLIAGEHLATRHGADRPAHAIVGPHTGIAYVLGEHICTPDVSNPKNPRPLQAAMADGLTADPAVQRQNTRKAVKILESRSPEDFARGALGNLLN